MTTYRQGDQGQGVADIQKALIADGYDLGAVDGIFGAKTTFAVKSFQKDKGLTVDGVVGPMTAARLTPTPTPGPTPEPSPAPAPTPAASASALGEGRLIDRCVALTGAFETSTPPPQCFSGLTGNFDGQGLSFGAQQQNFGQGSLQPMLKRMIAEHEAVIAGIFGDDFAQLQKVLAMSNKADQVAWAATIQTPKFNINQPWKGYFIALGKTPEYQVIEGDAAQVDYNQALNYCRKFGLKSERAVMLMFDIVTQNGSINATVTAQINSDFAALPADEADETPKLVIVANRRAEASKPQYVEDVRTRKLCIATGKGVVHGASYDLAKTYGITLDPAADLA
jgi:peptidoglycan hydrolase-like protein with peptidoglycan-binding domain